MVVFKIIILILLHVLNVSFFLSNEFFLWIHIISCQGSGSRCTVWWGCACKVCNSRPTSRRIWGAGINCFEPRARSQCVARKNVSVHSVEVTYDSDSVILHIACSWYKLSISTFGIFLFGRSLPVRPDPTLRGMHACNAIYLSHRGQQAQHEFLMSLHRRPFLCRFISLFNSTRLLTPSSWISGCVRRQHTCMCTVQRIRKSCSQRIRVLRSKISISIADNDRHRLCDTARIVSISIEPALHFVQKKITIIMRLLASITFQIVN